MKSFDWTVRQLLDLGHRFCDERNWEALREVIHILAGKLPAGLEVVGMQASQLLDEGDAQLGVAVWMEFSDGADEMLRAATPSPCPSR